MGKDWARLYYERCCVEQMLVPSAVRVKDYGKPLLPQLCRCMRVCVRVLIVFRTL